MHTEGEKELVFRTHFRRGSLGVVCMLLPQLVSTQKISVALTPFSHSVKNAPLAPGQVCHISESEGYLSIGFSGSWLLAPRWDVPQGRGGQEQRKGRCCPESQLGVRTPRAGSVFSQGGSLRSPVFPLLDLSFPGVRAGRSGTPPAPPRCLWTLPILGPPLSEPPPRWKRTQPKVPGEFPLII